MSGEQPRGGLSREALLVLLHGIDLGPGSPYDLRNLSERDAATIGLAPAGPGRLEAGR